LDLNKNKIISSALHFSHFFISYWLRLKKLYTSSLVVRRRISFNLSRLTLAIVGFLEEL